MTTTTTTEVGTYSTVEQVALHLGVEARHIMAVTHRLTQTLGAEVTVPGDGWNVLGAAPGEQTNNPTTLHLLAQIEKAAHTEASIDAAVESLYRAGLATVAADGWSTVAILSTVHDWGEESGGLAWSAAPSDAGLTQHRYPEPLAVCSDCLAAHASEACEDTRCVHHRRLFTSRHSGQRCGYCGS